MNRSSQGNACKTRPDDERPTAVGAGRRAVGAPRRQRPWPPRRRPPHVRGFPRADWPVTAVWRLASREPSVVHGLSAASRSVLAADMTTQTAPCRSRAPPPDRTIKPCRGACGASAAPSGQRDLVRHRLARAAPRPALDAELPESPALALVCQYAERMHGPQQASLVRDLSKRGGIAQAVADVLERRQRLLPAAGRGLRSQGPRRRCGRARRSRRRAEFVADAQGLPTNPRVTANHRHPPPP